MSRRLCMVSHSAFPADVRVAREVRAAVEAGFAVDVVATRLPGEPARERRDGAVVYRLPVSHVRGGGARRVVAEYVSFALLATLRVARLSVGRPYDVVQVHNPPDFLIVSALLPKLFGSRVVLDLHDLSTDMFSMRFGDRGGVRAALRLLQWIERAACRLADVVITVHEPYRQELEARGVPVEKLVVVLNSVDERLLPPEPASPVRHPFRIVYHGTITPHYGLGVVVDAFATIARELPDATLHIYGDGDAVATLNEQAVRLGVADRLELTGALLPQAEVLRRVQGAAVGVVPNLPTKLNAFALSTKLFEYVVLGIPVVAADLPTLRKHFADTEIAYFTAGSAESLADAIRSIAADFDLARRRAGAARARYDAFYTWGDQARTYVRVLTQLAAARAGHA